MNKKVIEKEKQQCAQILRRTFSIMAERGFSKKYKNIYFAGDNNFICDYLLDAVHTVNADTPTFNEVTYAVSGFESEYRKNTINTVSITDFDTILKSNGKNIVLFFADCIGGIEHKEKTLGMLQDVFEAMKNKNISKCVISVLLPKTPVFPNEINALSEREYSFFIEKICKKTPETEYYIELEKLCRHAVSKFALDISILRFDNVFAPDIMHTPSFDIQNTASECILAKHVSINEADAAHVSTLTYIRSACHAVFASLFRIKSGHVYNVAAQKTTMNEIKNLIHSYDRKNFSLGIDFPANIGYTHSSLTSLKFLKTGVKLQKFLDIGIYQLLDYLTTEQDEEV